MDCLNYVFSEADWVMSMKKELLENNKRLEGVYNFDFEKEEIKKGRWQIIDDGCKVSNVTNA